MALLFLLASILVANYSAQRGGAQPKPINADTSSTLAIENVSVITMATNVVLARQTVLIRGGRISGVAPTGTVRLPARATRIDGTGQYLIPGLVDSHVHLQHDESVNRRFLLLFLANGVTTVLNLSGTPMHLTLRAAVDRGEVLGPDIFTSGAPVGTPHGQTPFESPEQIAREVTSQRQAGYDFIKLHGDLSLESYRRLMRESRSQNLRVVGHAPRNLGVRPMLEQRQEAVAHLEEYLYAYFFHGAGSRRSIPNLENKIRTLALETAEAGTTVISTIEVYRGIADQIEDLRHVLEGREVAYVPRATGLLWGWWPPNNTYVGRFGKDHLPLFRSNARLLEQVAVAFQNAGVRLLAGTDTPTSAVVPGFSIHDELRDLVKAGLTPFEALQTATVNPATFLQTGNESGMIAVGRQADCVLLKGNPLDDIANTALIAGIVRNGRWMSEAQIAAALEQLAEAARR